MACVHTIYIYIFVLVVSVMRLRNLLYVLASSVLCDDFFFTDKGAIEHFPNECCYLLSVNCSVLPIIFSSTHYFCRRCRMLANFSSRSNQLALFAKCCLRWLNVNENCSTFQLRFMLEFHYFLNLQFIRSWEVR